MNAATANQVATKPKTRARPSGSSTLKATKNSAFTASHKAASSTRAVSKTARMELKTTTPVKEMLTKAARLSGVDLQAFVIGSAEERAREVIEHHDSIMLSVEEQKNFLDVLSQPPAATSKLKKLMALEPLNER